MADQDGTNEFSWSDKESVVIEKVDAIAVYTSPRGDIVIRQEGNMEDDSIIVVPQLRLNDLISALRREVQGEA